MPDSPSRAALDAAEAIIVGYNLPDFNREDREQLARIIDAHFSPSMSTAQEQTLKVQFDASAADARAKVEALVEAAEHMLVAIRYLHADECFRRRVPSEIVYERWNKNELHQKARAALAPFRGPKP